MKRLLFRAALAILALALPPAPRAAEAADRDYVRYTGDDRRGKLETVIITMKKDGATVDLIGAVHVADPEYYQALTKLFTGYEELLFELVDGQRMKEEMESAPVRPKRKRPAKPEAKPDAAQEPAKTIAPESTEHADEDANDPAFRLIAGMMKGVGSYFRLQYQTEGIDYHTKNFVHADVSKEEFSRMQDERGESFMDLFYKAMEAQLKVGTDRKAEPKGSQLLLALLGDSSGLKVAMARQLASADTLTEVMEEAGGTVIITDRNKKALEVFDARIAAGRKNLGIFYGAAHLADMEQRLEMKGWVRSGERWLTAWDIKPRIQAAKPGDSAK